jgi:hypothetical protein
LEVTLRKQLLRELISASKRLDWWNSYDTLNSRILKNLKQKVSSENSENLLDPNDLDSQLPFGFWIGLLSNRYHQSLWVPILNKSFPKSKQKRADIHKDLYAVLRLRNRIAHHEPIFDMDLFLLSNNIKNVLGQLDLNKEIWLKKNSRVDAVLKKKSLVLNDEYETSF